jgi:hypothetical protein
MSENTHDQRLTAIESWKLRVESELDNIKQRIGFLENVMQGQFEFNKSSSNEAPRPIDGPCHKLDVQCGPTSSDMNKTDSSLVNLRNVKFHNGLAHDHSCSTVCPQDAQDLFLDGLELFLADCPRARNIDPGHASGIPDDAHALNVGDLFLRHEDKSVDEEDALLRRLVRLKALP